MYRLLIVDDEPIITDGLYDLFEDIREPEFDLYKAYSGAEALAVMNRAKIDILLSDICMPDITGLELQREVRRQWPHCKVIFLTGFNDFEFIQMAVRNDSVDYILKTEGDEAILRAVNSAVSRIDRELVDRQNLQRAQDDRRLYASILGGKLLQEIVRGAPYSASERKQQFAELDIPLCAARPVLLLLGSVSIRGGAVGVMDRMKTLLAIGETGRSLLSPAAIAIPATISNNYIQWFIQPAEWPDDGQDGWDKLTLFVHGCMDSIQTACRHVHDSPLALVAASAPVCWEGTGQKYDRMKSLLIKAGGLSREALIIDTAFQRDEAKADAGADAVRAVIKRASSLKPMLENGQREEFLKLLGEMMGAAGFGDMHADAVKELYYSVSLILLSYINENRLNNAIGAEVSLEGLTSMDVHNGWEDATQYLIKLSERIFCQNRKESTNSADHILRFVKKYVNDNIDGDLSLTRISGLLHFNPSYFSRMFKSVTDTGYMEYVAGVKTARAKQMLAQSGVGINEIAVRLGFDAPSNFSRFFKKQVNLSPQEYRDSLTPQT